MNLAIALWLSQDAVTNGAIYALIALALVVVFTVTRVIFVPQGEFISYAALSLATLQAGKVPGTIYVLIGGGILVAALDGLAALRKKSLKSLPGSVLANIVLPLAIAAAAWWSASRPDDLLLQVVGDARDRDAARTDAVPLGVPAARERLGPGAADHRRGGALRAHRIRLGILRR